MNQKSTTGRMMILLLLVSVIVLNSCSQKLCSTYARSGDRAYTRHLANNRSQIPSSYSASYKTPLQRKAYSR